MAKLIGHEAIEAAEHHGLRLVKAADPTEGARDGLSVEEARAIAAEDPSLISVELDAELEREWRRVFPSGRVVDRRGDLVVADGGGWPVVATYLVREALDALSEMADGAGATEAGDAATCAALEAAGALVGLGERLDG